MQRPDLKELNQQSNPDLAPVKGVIFDLDGTLVTSSLNFSAIRRGIGCPQAMDILSFIDALPNAQQRQKATQQVIQFELDDAHTSHIIDGVVGMLMQLQHWQIPTAVVTRNCRAATEIKLQRHELYFETVLTRECAPAKPDPTSLLQIANDWSIAPENLIYVGDYLYDIHAAKNADMRSVYMNLKDEDLPDWHVQASWCFSDYQQLLEQLAVVNR